MIRIPRCLLATAALFAGLAAGTIPARAGVIIGNLPGNNGYLANIGQGHSAAAGFTMGATPYELTEAQLQLRFSPPPSAAAPLLQLRSNASGQPGSVLATFTPGTLQPGDHLTTFTLSNPFELEANTTYFLYLTSSITNGAWFNWLGSWTHTGGLDPSGTGATHSKYVYSDPNFKGSYQLNGDPIAAAVPEPSSVVMVAASLPLALGYFWRRRRGRVLS